MNKDQSDRKKEYAFEGNHCQGTITRILFFINIYMYKKCLYITYHCKHLNTAEVIFINYFELILQKFYFT